LAVILSKRSLLIVDDEPYILPTLVALLSPYYEVMTADSSDAAEKIFQKRSLDIILTDQKMPRGTGIELLEWVRQHSPQTIRLLMTGYADLEDAVEAINRGHVYYYLLKPWRTEELLQILRNAAEKFDLERNHDELLRQLEKANRELEERVTQRTLELERANADLEKANHDLQQQAEEMKRLALTDPLTGLLNRRAMDGLALAELKRHGRHHNPVALGIIDADHFREINRTYLLTGGDATLIGLAKLLTGIMRESDSVGRVGGEEFLVIARETNEEGARLLAERIRAKVENTPIEYHEHQVRVTVSIGFAIAEGATQVTYPQMYEDASAALKRAKDGGRNRCVIWRMEG
jgi:diguanylate cyclase (GGDEF)-like protein